MPNSQWICEGYAFWDDPPRKLDIPRHLCVVISDPSQDPSNLLIVNFSSRPIAGDTSCLIARKEYSELKKDSYIAYYYAQLLSEEEIVLGVQNGKFTRVRTPKSNVIRKIRLAAANSLHLQSRYLQLLEDQGLV